MCEFGDLQFGTIMCDCDDLYFAIFMCDCGDDGICQIVTICSLQNLFAIVVCILENVSPSLSFEHDVRTRLWTLQEAGEERERERERESPRLFEVFVRRGRVR